MVSDSIANASIPTAASNSKDFGKKKRVNRTAKLKQSKLDVRREQWLSHVKNRGLGFKEETNVGGVNMPDPGTHELNAGDAPLVKLEVSVGGEENEGLVNRDSDLESPFNSPTNFTGSSSSRSSCGSSSSSSSGRGGCFSRSVTDEDDGDHDDHVDNDDCVDDWEAMADALAADDVKTNHDNSNQEDNVNEASPKAELVAMKTGQVDVPTPVSFRAWRLDDASRPRSLPNLLKQNSFPMNSGAQFAPSSCPICCEDLDKTDSSFLPCPCGYRLCLFCHKKILEDNGRCPGCRKQYDQIDHKTASFKLTRCHSVNPK